MGWADRCRAGCCCRHSCARSCAGSNGSGEGHDVHGQAVAGNLRDGIPEGQSTADLIARAVTVFQSEQHIQHGQRDASAAKLQPVRRFGGPALRVAPVAAGQFARRLAQHALDAAAGQIGQAVRVEEGETVFQWVLIAQAGGERRDGGGAQREQVTGGCGEMSLAGRQCAHRGLVVGLELAGLLQSECLVVFFDRTFPAFLPPYSVIDVRRGPKVFVTAVIYAPQL